jgi:peroxiredoxin
VRLGDLVPSAVASSVVLDSSGASHRLAEAWARGPALVFVLRQFGCIGCSLAMSELAPRLAELRMAGLRVCLIGNAEPTKIADFVERHAVSARHADVWTDPTLAVHRALGLGRSWMGSHGPEALWSCVRAWGRGLHRGPSSGDTQQQGGALLVDAQGRIALLHRDRYLGDHLDPRCIVDSALGMLTARATARV